MGAGFNHVHHMAGGRMMAYYFFDNEDQLNNWKSRVAAILESIDMIEDQDNAVELVQGVLNQVNSFVAAQGEDMLPPDIKISVNILEGKHGLPQTHWTSIFPEDLDVISF